MTVLGESPSVAAIAGLVAPVANAESTSRSRGETTGGLPPPDPPLWGPARSRRRRRSTRPPRAARGRRARPRRRGVRSSTTGARCRSHPPRAVPPPNRSRRRAPAACGRLRAHGRARRRRRARCPATSGRPRRVHRLRRVRPITDAWPLRASSRPARRTSSASATSTRSCAPAGAPSKAPLGAMVTEHAEPARRVHGGGAVGRAELVVEPEHVVLDRPGGEVQRRADLGVGQPCADEPQDLALARDEAHLLGLRRLGLAGTAGGELADRAEQGARRPVLRDHAARARLAGGAHRDEVPARGQQRGVRH